MTPSHHPLPETLISYAAGTLSSAAACVVACHLDMCAECANEVRWLERLGGLMLSRLETTEAEAAALGGLPAPRLRREDSHPPHRKPRAKPDPLLPRPLARYMETKGLDIPWQAVGSGVEERSIELPNEPDSIRLLRLSPGEHLPKHNATSDTRLALVLRGACHDSAGTYMRGDIIEWEDDLSDRATAALGEAECVCLMTNQAIE